MHPRQREHERRMASQRRREREALEARRAEQRVAAQQAQWKKEAEQDQRRRKWEAQKQRWAEARKPKAKCCGGALYVVDNGSEFCRKCWDAK